jgi:hypothetical protein
MKDSCFDPEMPAALLAERFAVSISIAHEPTMKALVTFTCQHGATRRHSVYPGSRDWEWLQAWLWRVRKVAA